MGISSERASNFEEVKMDALEFLIERNRMCKSFNRCSDGCPAWGGSCKLETGTDLECEADKQVEIVKEWSVAHPRKTRQSVFLEQWPEANLDAHGCVCVRPCYLSATHRNTYGKCAHMNRDCGDCRREFWMQEV